MPDIKSPTTTAHILFVKVYDVAGFEVFDMEFEENMTLKIMGSIESDPTIGQISNESPLGKALIGKEKNDVVEFSTPAGIQKYKILSISY